MHLADFVTFIRSNFSEIFGFITGVLCVWLGAKEIVWAWPIGIVNNALYLVIFWRNGLYAIAGLQIIYAIISAYGWWGWLRGGEGKQPLPISHANWLTRALSGVAVVAMWLILHSVLRHYTDSNVPGWDALTTSLSITAQFMLSRKWIENWILWLGVDVIYIALELHKGLYITALLYLVFIILCTGGLIRWVGILRQKRVSDACVAQVVSNSGNDVVN